MRRVSGVCVPRYLQGTYKVLSMSTDTMGVPAQWADAVIAYARAADAVLRATPELVRDPTTVC